MKKHILILAIFFISCSSDEVDLGTTEPTCYAIMSRGYDARGNFIIVRYNEVNKRYKVYNYQNYIGLDEICDLSNLIEQPL